MFVEIKRSGYEKLKALFFGNTQDPASSNYQRLACLRQLAVDVQAHDTSASTGRPGFCQRIKRKLTHTAFSDAEIRGYNEGVRKACLGAAPDFVWLEWPLMMDAETLTRIRERWPATLLVCFQDDNPFGDRKSERPRWRKFVENIPLYDVHFLKRPSDIVEFTMRGAKRTLLTGPGVYESLFHMDDRPLNERGSKIPVSFVGTALDHRVGCVSALISRHQIPLHVYGARWNRTWVGWRYNHHFHGGLSSEGYTRVIWDSKICLAFVSSSNKDEYTGRSFEIPGSGGFLLTERTPKHQELYNEGKEAEFFSSTEECADKINFYLKNEEARQRIAAAGYERCVRSDYRLVTRMREALEQLFPSS